MNNGDLDVNGVHWSFWVIGIVTLIFNIAGIVNFVTQMNADTVSAMPDAYRAIIEGRPAWATGAFAVAVFGGALGCLLLLLKKSAAYYVFIASLLGSAGAQIPVLRMPDFPVEALIGGLMQFVVTAFLIWYSMRAERRGWLG